MTTMTKALIGIAGQAVAFAGLIFAEGYSLWWGILGFCTALWLWYANACFKRDEELRRNQHRV